MLFSLKKTKMQSARRFDLVSSAGPGLKSLAEGRSTSTAVNISNYDLSAAQLTRTNPFASTTIVACVVASARRLTPR
jgi:hypothetical protein